MGGAGLEVRAVPAQVQDGETSCRASTSSTGARASLSYLDSEGGYSVYLVQLVACTNFGMEMKEKDRNGDEWT